MGSFPHPYSYPKEKEEEREEFKKEEKRKRKQRKVTSNKRGYKIEMHPTYRIKTLSLSFLVFNVSVFLYLLHTFLHLLFFICVTESRFESQRKINNSNKKKIRIKEMKTKAP